MSCVLSNKLGINSTLPVTLMDKHTTWIDTNIKHLWVATTDLEYHYDIAIIRSINITKCTNCFCSNELFFLQFYYITIDCPTNGSTVGLLTNTGDLLYTLLNHIKIEQTRTFNAPIYYINGYGLHLGLLH